MKRPREENQATPITNFSSIPINKEPDVQPEQAKKESYQNKLLRNLANDEFSNYQVEVVERILHDSRTEEARMDRSKIIDTWKTLHNLVATEQLDIIDLLQEGQVVAVGNKEFILSYSNASL